MRAVDVKRDLVKHLRIDLERVGWEMCEPSRLTWTILGADVALCNRAHAWLRQNTPIHVAHHVRGSDDVVSTHGCCPLCSQPMQRHERDRGHELHVRWFCRNAQCRHTERAIVSKAAPVKVPPRCYTGPAPKLAEVNLYATPCVSCMPAEHVDVKGLWLRCDRCGHGWMVGGRDTPPCPACGVTRLSVTGYSARLDGTTGLDLQHVTYGGRAAKLDDEATRCPGYPNSPTPNIADASGTIQGHATRPLCCAACGESDTSKLLIMPHLQEHFPKGVSVVACQRCLPSTRADQIAMFEAAAKRDEGQSRGPAPPVAGSRWTVKGMGYAHVLTVTGVDTNKQVVCYRAGEPPGELVFERWLSEWYKEHEPLNGPRY